MPSSQQHPFFFFLVMGIALTVSVGLGGGMFDEVPTPAPDQASEPDPVMLVEDAHESVSTVPIEGVRTETTERANETERVRLSIIEDPPDQSRVEVIESTNRSVRFETVVLNNSTAWRFNEDEQVVVKEEADGYWISDTHSFGMGLEEMRETYEFKYVGTATVSGRETHVVEMRPPDGEVAEISVVFQTEESKRVVPLATAGEGTWAIAQETWWIDTETKYPVKQRIEWENETGTTVARTTRKYDDLNVGVTHDGEAFEFEPPADSEVTEPDRPEPTRFEDRAKAAEAVPFALPDPDLPEGFEFVNAIITDREERTSAVLLYYNGVESISIGISDGQPIEPEEDVVERNVGEIDGTVVATDSRPFITWECDGLSYRVHGPADTELIVNTAESIGCE